uniref:Uncharacterized protein n=1 Tax=Equus asinus asinus TaxID=83772 RepID=A0A8C4KTC7_EQUAS
MKAVSPAALVAPSEKIQFSLLLRLLRPAFLIRKYALNMCHRCFCQYTKAIGFIKLE